MPAGGNAHRPVRLSKKSMDFFDSLQDFLKLREKVSKSPLIAREREP